LCVTELIDRLDDGGPQAEDGCGHEYRRHPASNLASGEFKEAEGRTAVRKTTYALGTIVLALGLAACDGMVKYETDSRPAERQITVDGKSDDWVGALSAISDAKAEEGFLNDQGVLYICLITEDESLRHQIERGGLTVWFDPKGGDQKVLGIKYPLGTPRLEHKSTEKDEGGKPAGEPAEEEKPSLEILRDGGGTPQKLAISDAKGLEIASSSGGELFVYELKIPLQPTAGSPIALGAAPGTKIAVGFEVPKSEGGHGPGQGSGGMGGRGGGMGGGMGNRGMESSGAKGLKVWTYVKLSSGKSLAPAQPVN